MSDLTTLRKEMADAREAYDEARFWFELQGWTPDGYEHLEMLRKKKVATEKAVMKAGGTI